MTTTLKLTNGELDEWLDTVELKSGGHATPDSGMCSTIPIVCRR